MDILSGMFLHTKNLSRAVQLHSDRTISNPNTVNVEIHIVCVHLRIMWAHQGAAISEGGYVIQIRITRYITLATAITELAHQLYSTAHQISLGITVIMHESGGLVGSCFTTILQIHFANGSKKK